MAVFRKRLIFWVAKAYLRKWGKVILISFIAGLVVFFALLKLSRVLVNFLPIEEKTRVGMVGAYTLESLPQDVVQKTSVGLTLLSPEGTVEKGAAEKWEIRDEGKTYVVDLSKNYSFNDGSKLTAENIPYDFKDVEMEKADEDTLIFRLKDQYSPFLVTLSRPIIKKNLSGLGEYFIDDVEVNGDFIKSLTLVSREDKYRSLQYIFYPSEEALKIAFALGEIDEAHGLTTTGFKNTSLESFPNTKIDKKTNYAELVTLFFNNNDKILSDPKIRKALAYALPDKFRDGERSRIPYPSISRYADKSLSMNQDLDHAKLLLDSTETATSGAGLKLTIKTLPKYRPQAEIVAGAWTELGIESQIEEVSSVPTVYQVYLGDFTLPRDPDQYVLWHSQQGNNITRYKNLRIDKLLEDGRKVTDQKEREDIYKDFQKYILEDSPAAFLYFPYEYTVVKENT